MNSDVISAARRLQAANDRGNLFGLRPEFADAIRVIYTAILNEPAVFAVGQRVRATMECWGEPHSRPRCIESGRVHVVSAVSSDGLHFEGCNGEYPADCFAAVTEPMFAVGEWVTCGNIRVSSSYVVTDVRSIGLKSEEIRLSSAEGQDIGWWYAVNYIPSTKPSPSPAPEAEKPQPFKVGDKVTSQTIRDEFLPFNCGDVLTIASIDYGVGDGVGRLKFLGHDSVYAMDPAHFEHVATQPAPVIDHEELKAKAWEIFLASLEFEYTPGNVNIHYLPRKQCDDLAELFLTEAARREGEE